MKIIDSVAADALTR